VKREIRAKLTATMEQRQKSRSTICHQRVQPTPSQLAHWQALEDRHRAKELAEVRQVEERQAKLNVRPARARMSTARCVERGCVFPSAPGDYLCRQHQIDADVLDNSVVGGMHSHMLGAVR